MAVTYLVEINGKMAGFFCVSNDAIKREDVPRSIARRMLRLIPSRKRYRSMPAVKIGRLAVCCDKQRTGLGTGILDFMKAWFTRGNKTVCRFVIVDAYNKPDVLGFYKKNGFDFLLMNDTDDSTRLMCFDLATFQPPLAKHLEEGGS